MSKYYEVSLAIDARDYDVVIGDIQQIRPTPKEFMERTPDNDYSIFYWSYVLWEGVAVISLLRKLEGLRHALYTISEDDEVFKDVETNDSWGTDEQFYELLDVSAKLRIWGDDCTLEEKQPSLRRAFAIEWAGDSEDEDLSFLPKAVLIPENIPDADVADYLSDRYGFLVLSYSIEEAEDLPFDLSLPFPWAKFDISDEELERFEEMETLAEDSPTRKAFHEVFEEDADEQFANLISDYRAADKNIRSVIDATLVRLCGWSLPSLLRMAFEEAEEKGGAA